MSAHMGGSGPRSNAYSESKLTNWAVYHPFHAEVSAVYKRFDGRLPAEPAFPHIISLPPLKPDFIHPCDRSQVEWRLRKLNPDHIAGLRAVFLLSGTRKQQSCWNSALGCYGTYWRSCIFLYAHLFGVGYSYIDRLRDFYLDDVLVHEVAHHVDRFRDNSKGDKESFAYAYVQRKASGRF